MAATPAEKKAEDELEKALQVPAYRERLRKAAKTTAKHFRDGVVLPPPNGCSPA